MTLIVKKPGFVIQNKTLHGRLPAETYKDPSHLYIYIKVSNLHDAGDPGVRIGGIPQLVLIDIQAVLGNIRHLDAGSVGQHPQVLQQPRPSQKPNKIIRAFPPLC